MHARQGEVIAKVVKRHLTPFFFYVLGTLLLAAPIFFVIYLVDRATGAEWVLTLYAVAAFLTGSALAIISIDYLLDKLVITNMRVVLIDWRSLVMREENEVELLEIQDIKTHAKGILTGISIFDYGTCAIETAASKTSIIFTHCPNPEGVKHFILSQIAPGEGNK